MCSRTNAELKAHIEASRVIDASGCWLWTHYKNNEGYGYVKWNGKNTYVHKTYWLLCGKTIPDNLDLCHGPLCVGKKHCFNPNHLTADTRSKNVLDRHRDGTMVCKLTPEQVLEIRATIGMTQQALGNRYGVTHSTIHRIINRTIWKHI